MSEYKKLSKDEIIAEFKTIENSSVTRIEKIMNIYHSQDGLLYALKDLFRNHEELEEYPVSHCIRIFSDHCASGIWDCNIDDKMPYMLSQKLTNLLLLWNNWYDILADFITDYNEFYYKNYSYSTEHLPEIIKKEVVLYGRVGLELAKWVKLELPQCTVFYLTEWDFDEMLGGEYELLLNNKNEFEYKLDRKFDKLL